MLQVQSWISLKLKLDRSFCSLPLRLYKYDSIPLRFLASSSCDSAACRVIILPSFPSPLNENFVSLSHRPNWIRLFSVSCSHILAQSFLLLSWPYLMQFSLLSFQPAEEEAAEEEADIVKCKRPSDRWGSAQFGWVSFREFAQRNGMCLQ